MVKTGGNTNSAERKRMAKHIGIVACSAEGAALCYRTICSTGSMKMGEHNHPEISMHTYPLSMYMEHIRAGDWNNVAALMLSSSRKLAVLGTDYLMTGPVYRDALRKSGISWVIPEAAERESINSIIFEELVYGVFTSESLGYFISVIHRMKDLGCDGVILGCTEIPLLVEPAESPLPLLDSTRLLAEAAVRESLLS